MNNKFKPRDKVVWIRRGDQSATVLKITPKRIKIQLENPNQQSAIKYVKPASLKLVAHSKQLSPRKTAASESTKQRRQEDFHIKKTIISQLLSGLVSIVIGASVIAILFILANKVGLRWSDNSEHTFFLGAMFTSFGLIFLTGYVIHKQFEDAISDSEIVLLSNQYTFQGWVYASVLFALLMIFILLIDGLNGLLIGISEFIFISIGFGVAGRIIGLIQYARLKFERFDQRNHLALMSNGAGISACKMGILPFRTRVSIFWRALFLGLVGLLLIGVSFLSLRDGIGIFILSIGMGGFLTYASLHLVGILNNHNLTSVEGQITGMKTHTTKGNTSYQLICKNKKYTTSSQIWGSMTKGRIYKLWWHPLPFGRQVVASELLGDAGQDEVLEQREFAVADMNRNRKKYLNKALQLGLYGSTSQLESKWASLSPDKHQDVSRLYYTFEIPLENGSFYLGSPVSSEIDRGSLSLLNSDARIKGLVERITEDFDTADANPNYVSINQVIDNWAALVALGGEIVPTLITAGQKNSSITSQALITQLLGCIARDTKSRLNGQINSLLCQSCFVRYTAHKVYLPWIKTDVIYYGCRFCGHSRKFLEHSGDIIAVLDQDLDKYHFEDKELKVNWLSHRKMFDFDKVEIINAVDEDVERFVVQMGNNSNGKGRTNNKKMQCMISPNCMLAENTVRMLNSMFTQA